MKRVWFTFALVLVGSSAYAAEPAATVVPKATTAAPGEKKATVPVAPAKAGAAPVKVGTTPVAPKRGVPATKMPVNTSVDRGTGSSVGKTAFFVEPRPGFFVGKSTMSGFRGELAGGWYPGILDGAFAVVLQAGYYGAKGEDTIHDKDIGTITRNWDMTAIPVGSSVRWHFLPGSIRPYVAGGLEYTRVSFEYTASIPAGPIQEPKTTGLNSFLGPRGALGAAMRLGPGVLNGELAYSYAYLPADSKGDTGKILAPVLFLGYAITFGESESFEASKLEKTAQAERLPAVLAQK